MAKRQPYWVIALLLISGIALTYVIMQMVGLESIIQAFLNATWGSIIGFLCASAMLAMLLGYKWRVVIESLGSKILFRKLLSYRMVGYAISYLTPSAKVGGEPVRAYLASQHGMTMNKAMSSAIIDKAVELLVHVSFFSLGALFIVNTLRMEWRAKIIIGILTLGIIFMTFLLGAYLIDDKHKVFRRLFRTMRFHKIKRLKKVEAHLVEIEEFVEIFYREKRRTFYYLLALNAATWVLMYFEYYFGLQILGHAASVKQIFLMLTGVGIAYTIPFPMAFGVLELSQVGVTQLLGISAAVGVGLSLIIRARDLVWTGIGCVILVFQQLNAFTLFKKSKIAEAKIDKGFEKQL